MASKYAHWLFTANVGLLLLVFGNCVKASEDVVNVTVRPTKMWRFLDGSEVEVLQKFRENIDEFSVGQIKCLRYCIETDTMTEDAARRLHVNWKLENKAQFGMRSSSIYDKRFTPEILQGKSMKSEDLRNLRNKCTFSIINGCDFPKENEGKPVEIEQKFIKSLQPDLHILENYEKEKKNVLNNLFINEQIVNERISGNENEISFNVKINQGEISAIIFGNISAIDLKMPSGEYFGTSTTGKEPRLILASARMPGGASGLRLNVYNPPPGGWRLGLQGVRGESIRLIVASAVVPEFAIENASVQYFVHNGDKVSAARIGDYEMTYKEAGISSRQMRVLNDNVDETNVFDDYSEIHHGLPHTMRMLHNIPSVTDDDGQRSFKFPSEKTEFEMMDPNINFTTSMDMTQLENRMIDRQSTEIDDLSKTVNDELPIKKPLIVEINQNTELVAHPGTIHRVTFDITNNCILAVRHLVDFENAPFGIIDIPAGQTVSVSPAIRIPPTATDSVQKVTLRVRGIENVEKSANILVRSTGSRVFDDTKPTIHYYFNNNCAIRTSAEKCSKSYWSVDITIQDSESGLKSVSSTPKGVYPRSPYVSGTTSPVYFYYSSNCCNRVVEVTAKDISGNVRTRRIDVTEWYNLTEGEIAAVVIGTFFIILLIILIVFLILYCNQKESHNLPYSQRYGSRSTPRAE